MEELLKEWTARMETLVIPAWMQKTAASAGVIFSLLKKYKIYDTKTSLKFWPKNIYPCGLIMYCTTIVHKQTQPRKAENV